MADEDARSVGDGSVNADFEHCADDERPNEEEMEQGADSQQPAPKKRSAPGAKKAERQLKVGDKHHADWLEEQMFPSLSIPPCTNETPSFGNLGAQAMRTRNGVQDKRPLDFFRVVMTQDMTERVCNQTNIYADWWAKRDPPPGVNPDKWVPSWAKTWKKLIPAEFDIFMTVLFVMALSHDGPIRDFWSISWIYSRTVSSSLMSRDRFEQIRSALHAQEDGEEDPGNGQGNHPGTGRLKKIGILLDMFLHASRDAYFPGPNMAIDEAMLKFTGTSAFRFDRMPKPTRIGLKMWALCESGTGYVYNAMLDTRNKLSIHDMILTIAQPISDTFRTIYMENLFFISAVKIQSI